MPILTLYIATEKTVNNSKVLQPIYEKRKKQRKKVLLTIASKNRVKTNRLQKIYMFHKNHCALELQIQTGNGFMNKIELL